nr:MAG TPA: tail assembly chaperone [Caudoviricetes sp.]
MIEVNNIQLDFDITSPSDVLRYKQAGERMEAEGANIALPTVAPDAPGFLDAYVDMLNAQLRLFGNFIDEVFGDGVAEQLLGNNPSLNKVAEINDALSLAMEAQGKEFGVKLQKYKPNRATRRAKK